jgi:hypothetical protein
MYIGEYQCSPTYIQNTYTCIGILLPELELLKGYPFLSENSNRILWTTLSHKAC